MRHRLPLVAALLLFLLAVSAAVQASQQTGYTFDANGNLTSKTEEGVVWTYTYDVRDLLTEVRRDGVIVEVYRYDYAGRRIRRVGPDGVVHYLWDGDRVALETDGNGNTIAKYEYGGDRLLALNHSFEGRSFHLFDALGTPTVLVGDDGAAKERDRYDVWGRVRGRSGESGNRFGLTGHELDAATGLYYAKARFLDPELGRFLTEDPLEGEIASPPSLHRYSYAHQNPTTYWDPDGRAVEITATGPGQQVSRELDGQELYALLLQSGIDRALAESYVVQEGLGADIGADRIPSLAASITAHVDADLRWVAKEGTKIAVATAVGAGAAPIAGASRLGLVVADAVAGLAYQGTEDAIDGEFSGPKSYALAAGLPAGGGALVRGLMAPALGRSTLPTINATRAPGSGASAALVGPEIGSLPGTSGQAMLVVEGNGLSPTLVPAPMTGFAEQGRDAAGRFVSKTAEQLAPGADRALRVQRRLEHWFGPGTVQSEQYLRLGGGEIAVDPLTGEARRLDFVVVREGQVRAAVEVTSRTAGKVAQAAKEVRIRRAGGTHIKDRATGGLLDLSKVPTRIIRVK